MRSDDMVLAFLSALGCGVMGYVFYLSRRMKILDERIEHHQAQLDEAKRKTILSAAE